MHLSLLNRILVAVCLVAIGIGVATSAVHAQAYTKLQVLLPGETAAPGSGTGKLGTPTPQTVGVPFTVRVRACDSSWNTVTTVTNIIELSSSDASATLPGPTALVSGTANLSVTLNAAGSFTISAVDNSDPTIPQATSAFVTVYAVQGFVFDRINQKNQYAGVPMAIGLTAVDPSGNVVAGFSGPVRLQEITSYGVGRISPEIVNLSNGRWTGNVTLYRADETAINRGNVNIYAFLEANPSKNGTSDPFTVHPGTFSRVQIIVPGQSPLPGSVTGVSGYTASQSVGQNFQVEVYSTDQYWNPLPSADVVRITSSDPGASTPVSGGLVNGYRQFVVSLGTVGTQTLTVNDQTNGSIQGMTSAGIQVIPSAPHHFEIDPVPSPITAGDPTAITIRATDVGGNTIPDYSGSAVLSANTGPGSISPEAITFTNGVWSGNVLFRGAGGAVSFNCSDFSSPPHVGTSNTFQVLPGPYTKLQVLLPGQTAQGGTSTGFSGNPTDQSAGTSFDIRIRAVDQFWNRVTGVSPSVDLSSSDEFADMQSPVTLLNGELILPVTLFKSGMQTITAADAGSPSITPHTSSPVRVVGGPYARLVIICPGEHIAPGTPEGRSGTAIDQSINFAFNVEVYATDTWFNPVTGASDVVRLTSTDPLAQLPSDTPMVDGYVELTVRLATGGFQQLTASNVTQPFMPSSTTQVRAISSGFHLEAEVNPTTVQAGEPFDLTVKITNDAGAVIQEINTSVTVEVRNASTQDPGRGTLSNIQFQLLQGQRTMPETYTFAEPIVLTIRDEAGNTPAVTEMITVLPGNPAEVKLSSNPSWVRGNKHATVSARVVDLYDNGVPDQPVVFELLSGNGTLSANDTATSASGVATADFHAPRVPEVARVRATSNGLVGELDIETALVDPDAPGGTVTNYPNPFHPKDAPTTIAYKLSDDAMVTMRIYTLMGSLVLERRFDEGLPGGLEGLNEVQWDGKNGDGEFVSSGGYIVVIEAKGKGETIHNMRRKVGVVR